jgi:acyl carrier protein
MEPALVKDKIRDIISDIAGIPKEDIGDRSLFIDELDLDSLSMLEIGVDIDEAFELGLPDERYAELRCLQDAADMVMKEKAEQGAEVEVA